MKNGFLLLLFATFAIPSLGQKIHFTDITNQWTTVITSVHGTATKYVSYNAYFGDTLMYGYLYRKLNNGGAFVREDTTAGRVFIRWYNPAVSLDTGEQVLYNYNLIAGDTIGHTNMHSPVTTFTSWVVSLDSIQIGGIWHKLWYFEGRGSDYTATDHNFKYYVIEGIGCTNGFFNPLFPAGPTYDAYSTQLTCFYTHGTQPVLSTSVKAYGPFLYGSGSTFINFDNSTSCTLSVENELSTSQSVLVVPNPINDNSRIVFAHAIHSGYVTVYNAVGQKVFEMPIKEANEILIGYRVTVPGMYWYRITTEDGVECMGKFVR